MSEKLLADSAVLDLVRRNEELSRDIQQYRDQAREQQDVFQQQLTEIKGYKHRIESQYEDQLKDCRQEIRRLRLQLQERDAQLETAEKTAQQHKIAALRAKTESDVAHQLTLEKLRASCHAGVNQDQNQNVSMLDGCSEKTEALLTSLVGSLGKIEERLRRVEESEGRWTNMSTSLHRLETGRRQHQAQLGVLDNRLRKTEKKMGDLAAVSGKLREFSGIGGRLKDVETRLQTLGDDVHKLQSRDSPLPVHQGPGSAAVWDPRQGPVMVHLGSDEFLAAESGGMVSCSVAEEPEDLDVLGEFGVYPSGSMDDSVLKSKSIPNPLAEVGQQRTHSSTGKETKEEQPQVQEPEPEPSPLRRAGTLPPNLRKRPPKLLPRPAQAAADVGVVQESPGFHEALKIFHQLSAKNKS